MNKFFEGIKNISKKVFNFVKDIYKKVDSFIDIAGPIAIKSVEAFKNLYESDSGKALEFIITKAIPGTVDDATAAKLRPILEKALPTIMEDIQLLVNVAKMEDSNEKLKAAYEVYTKLSPTSQKLVSHNMATLIIESLGDGKLSLKECVVIAECEYQDFKENGLK